MADQSESLLTLVLDATEVVLLEVQQNYRLDSDGLLAKVDRMVRWVAAISPQLRLAAPGNSLLNAVVSIREFLMNMVETNGRRPRGRPAIPIRESHIRLYLDYNFSIKQIANLFGCSRRTIERRIRQTGINVHERYSSISDHELHELVGSVTFNNPNLGERSVDGILRSQGIVIQRQRLRDALWSVDPEGVHLRLRRALHRREYSVEAPNSLWHVDGYVTMHACIHISAYYAII